MVENYNLEKKVIFISRKFFNIVSRFLQIQAEDDQGWCKGRLEDGSEGLYPANYARLVEKGKQK